MGRTIQKAPRRDFGGHSKSKRKWRALLRRIKEVGQLKASLVRPPMCSLSALDFAGVKQLHFPCEYRPGSPSTFGKDLSHIPEVLGVRPIALKLSGHRQPSDGLGTRRNEAADGHIVC